MGKSRRLLRASPTTTFQMRHLWLILLAFSVSLSIFAQDTGEATPEQPLESESTIIVTETPFSTEVPEIPATPTADLSAPVETPPPTEGTPAEAAPEPEPFPSPAPTSDAGIIIITPEGINSRQLIVETFDAFTGDGWELAGWGLGSLDGDAALIAETSPASAAYYNFLHANFTLNAQVAVSVGSTLRVKVSGVDLLLDAFGNSRLYQGDEVLTTSPIITSPDGEARSYALQITAQAGIVTVTIDGMNAYSAALDGMLPAPLRLEASPAEGGSVALSQLILQELDPLPTAPEITLPPTEPTQTIDPTAETTDAAVEPESTADPVETSEPDTEEALVVNNEAEVALFVPSAAPFLTSDFESELTGWVTTGSVVAENDVNHVLLMAGEGLLAPAVDTTFLDVELVARVRWLQEDAALTITLGSRSVSLSPSQLMITVDETTEAHELALSANTWYPVRVALRPAGVQVNVDSALFTIDAESTRVEYAAFSLATRGAVMLDDVALTDFAPLTVETAPTASDKLTGTLSQLQEAINSGDADAIAAFITEALFVTDEAGRVRVEVFAVSYSALADVAAAVEALDGVVVYTDDLAVHAYLTPQSLLTVALRSDVFMLRQWVGASSTDISAAPSSAPTGTVSTEAFNYLGVQDWHENNLRGQNVRIGVIDTGFGTGVASLAPPKSGEYACINAASVFKAHSDPASVSNHGRNVVEILCDIAPSATVFMYEANSYASLASAINRARVLDDVDVLLITMDLGVHETLGDGTGRGGSDPYAELALARQNGIVVIAAAGNNGNPADIGVSGQAPRYAAITSTGGAITVNVQITHGDIVRVNTSTGTFSVSGAVSISDGPGEIGGSGVFSDSTNCSTSPCARTITISGTTSGATVQVQIVPVRTTPETSQTAAVFITSVSGGTLVPNAGSLARPADSPDVITVGAVCAAQGVGINFVRLPDASVGPVYGPGGTPSTLPSMPSIGYSRNVIKPDFVAPSVVTTSIFSAGNPSKCDGTVDRLDDAKKFSGSSAAAAHAAGMTALLLSNTSAPSYNRFSRLLISPDEVTNNVRFYFQMRSADLPAATANGFDMLYGAGIATLGNPRFNLNHVTNPTTPPDGFTCAGTIHYVGQANRNSGGTGTITDPFYSIGLALRQAAANDCVVVNPGEYTTPIVATGLNNNITLISYSGASELPAFGTIIRITGQTYSHPTEPDYEVSGFGTTKRFERVAGFYIRNITGGLTVEGFDFIPAADLTALNDNQYAPQALVIDSSPNVKIRRNRIGTTTVNGVDYQGWGRFNSTTQAWQGPEATPMLVIQSDNVAIEQNRFRGNTVDGNTFDYVTAALAVVDSTNALIRRNEFLDNRNITFDFFDFSPILLIEQSSANIVANAFSGNSANTVIQARTTAQDTALATRIVSNVFLNNVGFEAPSPNPSSPLRDVSGGLISVYFTPQLYVVNNTIVGNTFTNSNLGAIVTRGVPNIDVLEGNPNSATYQTLNFHNNLVHSNTFQHGILRYSNINGACNPNPSTSTAAITYNWFSQTTVSAGSCGGQVSIAANNNRTASLVFSDFSGFNANLQTTDWRYWGLAQNAKTSDNAIDKGGPIDQFGIPTADANNYAAPFDVDAFGRRRSNSSLGAATNPTDTDIGAFEFTELVIDDNDCDGNGRRSVFELTGILEDQFPSSLPYIVINLECDPPGPEGMTSFIQGAAGSITFAIPNSGTFDEDGPAGPIAPINYDNVRNYSTRCGDQFEGTRGVVALTTASGSGRLLYCPPEHFYNQGITDPDAKVEIFYIVTDEAGATATGKIEVTINPTADLPLTASIGDDVPLGDILEITMLANTTATLPLRPFVVFGNFEWSEAENPEFNLPTGAMADYPFTLSSPIIDSDPRGVISTSPAPAIVNNQLQVTSTNNRGTGVIRYTVTDANGKSTTNYVRVRVRSVIPNEPGLYDDSSIYWRYENAQPSPQVGTFRWQALSNPRAINNTLHQSNGSGDRAIFQMIGTGFVLYMQGTGGAGAQYKIRVNDVETDVWSYAFSTTAASNPPISTTTIDLDAASAGTGVLTCYAGARNVVLPASTPTRFLSNNMPGPYTVMCNGTTNQQMEVVIENGSPNGPTLAIDAFGLLDDTTPVTSSGPFGPGTYDFDNAEMRNIFASKANWAEVRVPQLTRAIAFRAVDGADDVSFRINGATGFALGTTLMPAGAEFRLCVRDVSNNHDLCQLVDTSPLGVATPLAYNAYVPWYGLNDEREYEITISGIVRPALPAVLSNLGTLVLDGLVVFGPQHNMNGTLPNGTTENDQLVDFAYLGGIEDSWVHAFNVPAASNQSLSTTTVTHAGPFLAFRIAADAEYFLYDFNNTNALTRQLMICVDRHVLTAATNDFGRCIVVDTRAGTYRQVLGDDGTLSPTNGTANIRPTRNTLLISDDLFVGGWPNVNPTPGYHQVEIFSLLNEPFNFDRVTVYGAGVLPPGVHEDFAAAVQYYDNTNTLMTPGVFNPRDPVLNFNASTTTANTFLIVNDGTATRDSSGSVVWTKQVGASVVFGVDGDGFIPRFRLDRQSDAVSICWLRTSGPLPLPNVIRSTGTCVIYENFSAGLLFNQMRPITGLDNTISSTDYYAVAITHLGDNLTPVKINAPYLNMWFDGVTVLNDDWQSLTPLTPGTVYETSFVNRAAQNRFAYSPTVWSTVNGPVTQFSGGSYDISRNIMGASVTFRTSGADAVRFRRNLSAGQALLQFCAALETTPNDRRCVVVNNAGSGFGHHVNVLLNETGSTAPHVVSITALTAGNFILDTIEPVVNTTPLTAGFYDDDAVGISYFGGASANLVPNGSFESFDQVGTQRTPSAWAVTGSLPAANFTSGAPAFNGSLAGAAVVTGNGQGILSSEIAFKGGRSYIVTARVMIDGATGVPTPTVTLDLFDGSTAISAFTPQTVSYIATRAYQVVYYVFSPASDVTGRLRFVGNDLQPTTPTNLASRRFLVDEVGVFEVGQADWETVVNNAAFGRYVTRSIQPGAEARFSFTGTGVRIGMVLDTFAGRVEICYATNPALTGANCVQYENERAAATTRVSRTIAGLTANTYYVRIRDTEEGTTALTAGNPSRPRTAPMGRVAIDFVEVLNDPLPPTILTDVTANETFQISGVNALQLLPTNGWLYRSAPNLTAFSGNSNVAVADPNSGAVSSVIAGHVGVMRLDLSQGATVVLYSDAPNATKADLLYCVDGQDGEITFNPLTRRYGITGSTRCGVTSALATSAQAVLVLSPATANSTLTFTALAPAPLLIDGYQVLLGTQLAPGYYETSLSESGTCVGTLSNNGCVGGSSSSIFSADTPSNWFRQSSPTFSGGTSLVLSNASGTVGSAGSPRTGVPSRLTFQIENATGFSLITTTNPLGGSFNVTAVGTNTFTFTGTTQSPATFNRVSIPFTGLPLGNYTVTIENTTAVNLYVDAIEVYGELYALGSLYDDSARDLNGDLLITYGPSVNTWTRVEGNPAATSLNRTFHAATAAGAVAMFEVGENDPATGIKIYTSSPTAATAVQVCWKDLDTPASAQQCGSPLNLTSGRATQMFTSAGHYAVSIVNTLNQRLQLDAVQVMEAGGLTEGIYTVQELRDDTNANFNGTWTFNNATNATTATRTAPASQFTFTMKGIGFSILLNESTASASPYTLCVTRATPCDTVNQTINRIPAPLATSPFALTVVGLHNASGQNETYTVTLSSTDTRPLTVSGLHILGAKPSSFRLDASSPRAEDDDPRLRTLPFNWTVLTVNRTGSVSGDSQALGTRRGGVFYFEFAGSFPAVEYVRQISTAFSNVDICFGPIGSTASLWANHTTNCVNVDNKEANAFARATVASTSLTCTAGCWVIVRPAEDRQVALDLVRLVAPGEPLKAGLYEENFPGLRHFNQTSSTTYDISANADDLMGMHILPRITAAGASGTFVRRYVAATTTAGTSALNGGLYFTMEGTGFSVGFVNDPFQDEVRICYLNYTGPEPNVQTVLTTGRCQTFDNQSAATAFRVNRSILGLPQGTYAGVVQMLADNGIPAVHAPSQLPLRMDIDTVTIYDDMWFANSEPNWLDDTHTTAITPAMGRVETNFNNRMADRRVQFFGTWSNVANARYSGGRYDLTSSAGAGILFRTANANAITLYTALGNAFTEVIICATPLNLNPLTQSGSTTCVEESLRGTGFQQPINVTLGDAVDEYVVSITTKRNAQFHLDAIQVFDSTVALTPGLYESSDARIRYDRTYQNLVPNGDFEVTNAARVPLHWTTVGSPTSFTTVNSAVINGTKYATFSGGVNTGIRSETFTVPTTGTYPIAVYVLLTRGSAQVRLREETPTGVVTDIFPLTRPSNVWQVYRKSFELVAGNDYFIEIVSTNASAIVGVDAVQVNTGGLWTTEFNGTYSGGSLRRSLTAGASATFNFTGTGFALGMLVDRSGGETEVCYGVGTPTNCFVYQNELAAPSARVSRVIAGLPLNTYVVRIREMDDGFSTLVLNNPQALRPNANVISRVALDTVEIFGATTLPALPTGSFNENATNPSGVPYFRFFPENRFRVITGGPAAAFSDQSFAAVVENNGAISNTFAGPSMVFNINKQQGRSATLVFSLGPVNASRSTQVLICAGNNINGAIAWNGVAFQMANAGTPGSCTLRTTARADRELIVNAADLSALSTSASGTVRVSITALVPGRFEIDGVTYIQGNALPSGLNDDFLAAPPTNSIAAQNAALLKFAVGNNFGVNRDARLFSAAVPTGCRQTEQWCLLRNNSYFGTTAAYTRANDATLTFNFEGTGFGLMVQPELNAGDLRICYKRASNQTAFPSIGGETDAEDVELNVNSNSGIYCERVRLNTATTGATPWQGLNRTLINPNASFRYTFAYYGLPQGRYTVEVRTILPVMNPGRVVIDAVNVFSNPTTLPPLQPGLHDDNVPSIRYEPSLAWARQATPAQPPAGAYGRAESITRLAGSVAQLRVEGNSVTFFQSLTGGSSRHVNLCLLITAAGSNPGNVHCGETSQTVQRPSVQQAWWSQAGAGRMSPVMIYGLGEGVHTLIIENRDHNRPLSIDAIAVQP